MHYLQYFTFASIAQLSPVFADEIKAKDSDLTRL